MLETSMMIWIGIHVDKKFYVKAWKDFSRWQTYPEQHVFAIEFQANKVTVKGNVSKSIDHHHWGLWIEFYLLVIWRENRFEFVKLIKPKSALLAFTNHLHIHKHLTVVSWHLLHCCTFLRSILTRCVLYRVWSPSLLC
jgi:hypothetical protein